MEMKIAGLGKINVDLIFGGLPRLPEVGEELYAKSFGTYLGGGTPATLIALARLNVPVLLGTYLGQDMFSAFAGKELNAAGIELCNLYSGDGIPVNVTAVMLTPGDRTFATNNEIEGLSLRDKEFIDSLTDVKVAIMKLDNPDIYRKLKENGVKLVLDPGYDCNMSLDRYGEFLRLADYYLPNRKEALLLTKTEDYESAARVLSEYLDEVVVKLDSEGAYIYRDKKGEVVPTLKVAHKDSTGAGDAFLAGFCYGLYRDFCLRDCVRAGNFTGARCVTEVGCLTARTEEAELLAYLGK